MSARRRCQCCHKLAVMEPCEVVNERRWHTFMYNDGRCRQFRCGGRCPYCKGHQLLYRPVPRRAKP